MNDFFSGRKVGATVDVQDILDATFLEHTVALVDAGALVSVGTTRDRGAVSITVTVGGKWRREYVRTDEEAHEFLSGASTAVNELRGSAPAPTEQGRPRRRR